MKIYKNKFKKNKKHHKFVTKLILLLYKLNLKDPKYIHSHKVLNSLTPLVFRV